MHPISRVSLDFQEEAMAQLETFPEVCAAIKGALERSHRFMRSNFEPGRVFANHLDFQDRLDAWTDKANGRVHRTIRAVPAERLAEDGDHDEPP